MDNLTQILEAILFASGSSRKKADIMALLPDVKKAQFDKSIEELKAKYSGESGVLLLDFNGKLQFSTNTNYGDIVAEVLTPLKEKELSKTLLEVLAIIAYKQPITRIEIEKIKATSADYAIGLLLKVNLIEVVGRKDAVGRPVLYGCQKFLNCQIIKLCLKDLRNWECSTNHKLNFIVILKLMTTKSTIIMTIVKKKKDWKN